MTRFAQLARVRNGSVLELELGARIDVQFAAHSRECIFSAHAFVLPQFFYT